MLSMDSNFQQSKRKQLLLLLTIDNISSLCCKAYVWFVHGEQCPGLGAEVDAVKASKRNVTTL